MLGLKLPDRGHRSLEGKGSVMLSILLFLNHVCVYVCVCVYACVPIRQLYPQPCPLILSANYWTLSTACTEAYESSCFGSLFKA